MKKNRLRSSFWDGIFLVSGKVLLMVISIAAISMTTRILGAAGYGKLSLFLAVIQAFYLFGVSWTQSSIVRYGVEEFSGSGKINATILTRMVLFVPLFILSMTLLCVFRESIGNYIDMPGISIGLLAGYLLCVIISTEGQFSLRAVGKLKLYGFLQSIEKGILIVGLCLILLKVLPSKIDTIILLYMSSTMIVGVMVLAHVLQKNLFPLRFDKKILKRMILFSLPLMFRTVNVYLFNWIDIIVIKKYMAIKDVGTYSLAYNGISILQQLSMMTTVITIPLLIKFLTDKKIDHIKRYVTRIVPQALFLWMILLMIAIVGARPVVRLLGGNEFNQAIFPFAGLLIGLLASGLSSLYTPVLQAYEMVKEATMIAFISTPLNIFGDILLVPRIGVIGAVISTSMAFFITAIFRHWLVSRKLDLEMNRKMLFFVLPLTVAFTCFVVFPSGLNMVLGVILIICLLVLFVKKSRLFSKDDLMVLEHIDMPIFLKTGITKFFIAAEAISGRKV